MRANAEVIRAFGAGHLVQWKYKSSSQLEWNSYIDGGPMLGATHHEATKEEIEWRVHPKRRHTLSLDKDLVEAFAEGKDLEWKSSSQDWSIYKGGIRLTSPDFGAQWKVH